MQETFGLNNWADVDGLPIASTTINGALAGQPYDAAQSNSNLPRQDAQLRIIEDASRDRRPSKGVAADGFCE